MKMLRIIIVLLYIVMGFSMVYADPFLYCDPFSETILLFEISINGDIIQIPPQIISSGYRIKFDLVDYKDVDELNIKARAFNGLWGEWSNNLIIIKPDPPSNLRTN